MIMYSNALDILFGWQPSLSAQVRAAEAGTRKFWRDLHEDMKRKHREERRAA